MVSIQDIETSYQISSKILFTNSLKQSTDKYLWVLH